MSQQLVFSRYHTAFGTKQKPDFGVGIGRLRIHHRQGVGQLTRDGTLGFLLAPEGPPFPSTQADQDRRDKCDQSDQAPSRLPWQALFDQQIGGKIEGQISFRRCLRDAFDLQCLNRRLRAFFNANGYRLAETRLVAAFGRNGPGNIVNEAEGRNGINRGVLRAQLEFELAGFLLREPGSAKSRIANRASKPRTLRKSGTGSVAKVGGPFSATCR